MKQATHPRPAAAGRAPPWAAKLCVPGTGTPQEVQVLPQVGHIEGSEAQGREGDRPSEGSVERICEPTYRNDVFRAEGDCPQFP